MNEEEEAILAGARGPAAKKALRFQIEVGNFFGAKRMVPITNAHVMGDIEVMGDGGLEYMRALSQDDSVCAVPTSRNATCMHGDDLACLKQDDDEIAKEHEIVMHMRRSRIATTDTCINYQTVYQPKLGEHVAWGDTGTVAYANSVFGARTNYEGGYSSFAAALTGRTPDYGFHLDEARRGSFLVRVRAKMDDIADWGALGKIVGHPNQDYFAVPVFDYTREMPPSDSLKHLGASLASYGSMAMFHMIGVTPEAHTQSMAFGGARPAFDLTVTDADLDGVYRAARFVEGGKTLVVFSAPQLSLFEIKRLVELFDGRRVARGMEVFITTSHSNYSEAQRLGYAQALERSGAVFLKGVCFYILQGLTRMRQENGWANLVSNSGKLVNTITAHRFNTVLRRTRECVEIACTGDPR
ncbi:MAG TPA: aconitase X catalytic domain-containing protein [Ramlibacter sp.]|uniref:aconitase X catalytic domain-containing protein n=1 Tax=Ramlibacter sp. TaxID=1917967 RepID=UPI002BA6C362|nr:aconitase X catalytic domain-containing protein [Ramlibacter sp.]HVZ45963.1 aconitase X catalytic domain-containing protein [Ramlibacter sp.]